MDSLRPSGKFKCFDSSLVGVHDPLLLRLDAVGFSGEADFRRFGEECSDLDKVRHRRKKSNRPFFSLLVLELLGLCSTYDSSSSLCICGLGMVADRHRASSSPTSFFLSCREGVGDLDNQFRHIWCLIPGLYLRLRCCEALLN